MLRRLLLIGGSGELGRAVLTATKGVAHSTNVDFKASGSESAFVPFTGCFKQVQKSLPWPNFDMIAVTAGGWKGGKATDDDVLDVYKQLSDMIVKPSLFGCKLADSKLNKGGMLVLVGANGVFAKPAPSMFAYALCKGAVHGMNQAFLGRTDISMATILFDALDTPSNRQFTPKEQHENLLPSLVVGQVLRGWLLGVGVPPAGSFYRMKTAGGKLSSESFLK